MEGRGCFWASGEMGDRELRVLMERVGKPVFLPSVSRDHAVWVVPRLRLSCRFSCNPVAKARPLYF